MNCRGRDDEHGNGRCDPYITGQRIVDVEYLNARAVHEFQLQQHPEGTVSGLHSDRLGSGQINGMHGHGEIALHSKMPSYFAFSGELITDSGSGTLTTGAAMDEHASIGLRSQFGVGAWAATAPIAHSLREHHTFALASSLATPFAAAS
ncbi:hypothetical protein [Sinorhizobium meliloti]|uniref:hypothetical protein n=1 Tax=Rhizobium meliloti TaxID=382 RepID=UPI001297D3E3|nr:hypothetical protein [Sinorhizobium meliloti]MQW44732.1 hypothetical protein [Sinorhizobium meliloti]